MLDRRDHGRHEPRCLDVDLNEEIHTKDQEEDDAVAHKCARDIEHDPDERDRDRDEHAGQEDAQR